MIATVPPLWRDADAYVQLTENPLVVTFWGHAPAYSYVAKLPLFAGEQWERWRGNVPTSPRPDSSQPALTDTGIWLLIIGQHLGLSAAIFGFIRAVSSLFWVRLSLALAWASNALFYSYAHCLGSETLGLILIVVLATKGLRLVQSRNEPAWRDWYLTALILCGCILSRDLNLALIALLPAAFLLAWAMSRAGVYFRHAVVALAVGLACVTAANSLKKDLARKTKLHPHSRIGFTFLWRLNFLDNLSPEARGTLLRKVAARARSGKARKLIALLEQMHAEKADVSCGPFMQRAILLFDGHQWEELDRALNEMAYAFLLPPTHEHLQVTKQDLARALTMPTTEIASYLFATTAFYFEHKDEMTAAAGLVTFRGTTPEQLTAIPLRHFYFQLWRGLGYHKAFAVWVLALAAYFFAAARRETERHAISAIGIALTAIGLLICGTACLLHELEPRFVLSMWQMLVLSVFLFAGKTAALLAGGRAKVFEPQPDTAK